jgi:arylsulfatase A-like enzyme
MKQPFSEWNPFQMAVASLSAGLSAGLVETFVLLVIDRATDLTLGTLAGIVMAYGAVGLLVGLGLSLLRGLWGARAVGKPCSERLLHIGRNLVAGVGAGLMAGIGVALVEVAGLVIMDLSWWPLTDLLYAVVAYGILGLLFGLGLGLLRGLWCAWRARDGSLDAGWVTFTTLLASLGTFLVVHNRVRRDVLEITFRSLSLEESILVDSVLLASALILAVGLWFLLRRLSYHAWMVRLRWNVGLYLAFLLVATLIGSAPRIAATLTPHPAPRILPDLRNKPNVIFIVADTLRADRLGCYGNDSQLTPHLDALAQDGVLYRQMSAQASWTKPSVATMITSLYPSSHRAQHIDIDKLDSLSDEVTTLPEVLHERGYRTTGFTTNLYTSSTFNFQQGYDEYIYLKPTDPFFASPISSRFAVFSAFTRLRSAFLSPAMYPHDEEYQDAATLNQHALAWLETNRGSRFFLYLHYMDPHGPYFAHPYNGVSSIGVSQQPAHTSSFIQLYNGEVAYLDSYLGRLFDQLKAWGLYDDMLIIFTADHGEEFYEHGGWWHGYTLYEEQLAVPLVIKYPGNAYAGTVDTEFARSLDLAPTVLDMIGEVLPETMQGVSLRPGATASRPTTVFAEVDYKSHILRAIRTQHFKLIVANPGNPRGLPPEALFDLQTDPGEQRNLAPSEPDAVRLLRAQLDRAIAAAEALAVAGQTGVLDAATRERLRQLGY